MKVKDLIEQLKQYDPELEVGLSTRDGHYGEIGHIEKQDAVKRKDWDDYWDVMLNPLNHNPKKVREIVCLNIYTREVMGR